VRPVAGPGPEVPGQRVLSRWADGRWIWALSGLATAVALIVLGIRFVGGGVSDPLHIHDQPAQTVVTRTLTVAQPVTSLAVQSYGAPVRVTTEPVRHVQVTEMISYDPYLGGPPSVTQSVSGGRLLLTDPACGDEVDCGVSFVLTVPPGLSVTAVTNGGALVISGTAGANLDSGGGNVQATLIHGPLIVTTGGGPLAVTGLDGPLRADTDGGSFVAGGLDAPTVTVSTNGGDAQIAFAAAPDLVSVTTSGGPAVLTVPGGPYALSADSGGGPAAVAIAASPAAQRSITVSTDGGPLRIAP
jgi:hypothetical protein